MEREINRLRGTSSDQPTQFVQTISTPSPLVANSANVPDTIPIAAVSDETPPLSTNSHLSSTPQGPPNASLKSIGQVVLSAAQVEDLFRIFSDRCLPHLPMTICLSPDILYKRCPLLFWVICSAAAVGTNVAKLKLEVAKLVANSINTAIRSVEVVQALLILCLWPFPFQTTTENPSLLYAGVAIQAGLQLGLHRPEFGREYTSKKDDSIHSNETKSSTWLGCYIVGSLQSIRLGVPFAAPHDFSFESAAADPKISPVLIALYRYARFGTQFNEALGASPSQRSGLLEPRTRLGLIRIFQQELALVDASLRPSRGQIVDLTSLSTKIQLLSFAVRDDMVRSEDLISFYQEAQTTAIQIIQSLSDVNLSTVPHSTISVLMMATFVLIKILWSPYGTTSELLRDKIECSQHALSTAVKIPGDHIDLVSRLVLDSLTMLDLKKTPSIQTRMSASLGFDQIRVRKEHFTELIADTDWSVLDETQWQELWETTIQSV